MHSGIYADALMRSVALATARNQVGANRPITEVLASEGITQQEYDDLGKDPQFRRYIDAYAKELTESGFSFAAKSRLLAEDLLPMAYQMARDRDTPAPVRAKMIENLVEWGDLKPRKDISPLAAGSGFSITINIPPPAAIKSQIIDITPECVDEVPENVHYDVHSDEDVQVMEQIGADSPEEPIFLKPVDVVDEKELQKKLEGLFDESDDYVYAGQDFIQ